MSAAAMRLADARNWLSDRRFGGLVAFNDGQNSFLDANAVFVFTGVRAIGRSAVVIAREGPSILIVEPSWDAERAMTLSCTDDVIATDSLVDALGAQLEKSGLNKEKLATIALDKQSMAFVAQAKGRLGSSIEAADGVAAELARIRSPEELDNCRRAVAIAERGYEHLLEVAKTGRCEFELAADIYMHMKWLGAEDNFLLMSASQHNLAVRAAGNRILEEGDVVLAEITPCYRGQFAQICRTAVLGQASSLQRNKYLLLQEAMRRGMDAAVPGATVGEAAQAMNDVFRKAGYGSYCRPPYMRVRGHGLGVTSDRPGDISDSSAVIFEEGMTFVIHPNQYLPETGYLMCGETVMISHNGAISLSERDSELGSLPL